MRSPLRALLVLALLLLGGMSPEEALRQGDRRYEAGDLPGALVHWSQGLQAARAAEDRALTHALLLRLASAHRDAGRLDNARALLEQAGALATTPEERARVAVAEGLLGLAEGRPEAAETRLQQAFRQASEARLPDVAATAALNTGLARLALGRPEDAARAFESAGRLFETLGDPVGQAEALNNLGVAERRRGRLGPARAALERGLGAAPVGTGLQADLRANLAALLQDLGRADEAEALYRQALEAARARRDLPRQGALLHNLATLRHEGGDEEAAATWYAAAAEAFEAAEQPARAIAVRRHLALLQDDPAALDEVLQGADAAGDRRLQALVRLDLAVRLRTLEPGRAETLAAEARALAEALELQAVRWRSLALQGELALAAGRTEQGIERLEEAVELLEASRAGLDREDTERLAQRHQDPYHALIDALLTEGRAQEALLVAERLALSELGPELLPEGEATAAVRRLQAEQAWVGEALEQARERADPQQAERLRERLAELRVAFARAVDQLRTSHPHFAQLVRVDPEDLEAVQAELEPGVVVLQPIVLPDRLALLVFRHDGLVARTVPVGAAEVAAEVRALVRMLRSANTFEPWEADRLAEVLGGWLLAPVAEELADARVVVVPASGALRQVPLAALHLEGEPLAARAAVVTVTHVGSLRRPPEGSDFSLQGAELLLVGNPDGTLPGARDEVRAIASLFPGATARVGPTGGTRDLLPLLQGRRAIHLATHGVIDPVRPDRSYLVLDAHPEEGRLYYGEIPGLAPYLADCRLVVLSACESGVPVDAPASADPGEVMVSINGLAAQFRRAGVETLLGTLWRVDDEATRLWMEAFYEGLAQGMDPASAVQRAQNLRRADPERAHPWYWAGFVLVGDWR